MPKRGQFFSVDRRAWAAVCDLGNLNAAAAYLMLAQGAAPGTCSKWSVTALQKYTGMRWERGRAAIDALTDSGFIRQTGTREKPCYELLAGDEIARSAHERKLAGLTEYERRLIGEIRVGDLPQRSGKIMREALDGLRQKGIIIERGYRDFALATPAVIGSDRDPIWLPNSLIVGAKSTEDAPLKRLRMAGDPWTLRLLIDLYHAQNLRDDGGINPKVLRQVYSRRLVGEQGIYQVWGFRGDSRWISWNGPLSAHRYRTVAKGKNHPAWDSIDHLERQGLLTWVLHLWTGDPSESEDAEILHPYGLRGYGEPLEIEIGTAAHLAGGAMVPDWKRNAPAREGFSLLAPVVRTLPNVQMVGVGRLRYRPHTTRTSQWYTELAQGSRHWREHYRELARSGEIKNEQTA